MNIIKVKNIKFRDALMNRGEGETVYCEEENTCYTWSNNSWNEVSSTVDAAGEIKVNYRDLVVNAISNFEPFTIENTEKYQVLINNWDEIQNKEYYMLYARELDYFTLLHRVPEDGSKCLGKEIMDCLWNLGYIIYIEDFTEEDDRVIFWIKTDKGLVTEVYLFDYTEGVVPFV